MSFSVFIHRGDSIYDDIPSERYQFPKQYLGRAKQSEGDWIVYLEPSKVKETKGYFAVAKVQEIIPDPRKEGMFLALIEPGSYLDFGAPVSFRHKGQVVETGLLNEQGAISGRAQAAVRPLSDLDFAQLIRLGLNESEPLLPRAAEARTEAKFEEAPVDFDHLPVRERVNQLTSRVLRDRNFRKIVLNAYDERCAVTGLKLINGGGRAEVEAAHIKPVEENGPDIVSNGIALSGAAHWMFDRGLIGLSDDLDVLVSRQSNDISAIYALVNHSGRLLMPRRPSERPHNDFVRWHRENRFKC